MKTWWFKGLRIITLKTKLLWFKDVSHLATPRYLETPLENPLLRLLNVAKYSSFETVCISSSSFVYVSICIAYENYIHKWNQIYIKNNINQLTFVPGNSRLSRGPNTLGQQDHRCEQQPPHYHMPLHTFYKVNTIPYEEIQNLMTQIKKIEKNLSLPLLHFFFQTGKKN